MTNILDQRNYKMRKKRILKETPEQWYDFSNNIVNNVFTRLTNSGYEQYEIDNIVNKDAIELDMIDGNFVLYCGNDIIYSAPADTLVHEYIENAEEALSEWCINKIGREIEPIDASMFFDESKKCLKLSEYQFKKLIGESVKNILSEISWSTAREASAKSENRVDLLDYAWYDFETAAETLIKSLNGIDERGYYTDYSDPQPGNMQGPKLAKELENLTDKLRDYYERKKYQSQNLQKHADTKFSNTFNGRNFNQVADDIEDVREKYWDSDERSWDSYREKHLTPDEIDFDNRY